MMDAQTEQNNEDLKAAQRRVVALHESIASAWNDTERLEDRNDKLGADLRKADQTIALQEANLMAARVNGRELRRRNCQLIAQMASLGAELGELKRESIPVEVEPARFSIQPPAVGDDFDAIGIDDHGEVRMDISQFVELLSEDFPAEWEEDKKRLTVTAETDGLWVIVKLGWE